LRRLARLGAFAVAAGAVGYFLLQGADAAGAGLSSVVDPALLASTAGSLAGVLLLCRLAFALATAALFTVAWPRTRIRPARWHTAFGGVLGAGLVVTTAAVGHASAGPWWPGDLLSTSLHVTAMAVWLGGLTGLLTATLRPGVPAGQLAVALPRFSRLAFTAVSLLVLTGVVQTVREVNTPTALVDTEYGWTLTVKLMLLAIVLGAAGVSRVWVQRHYRVRGRRPGGRRRVTAHAFAATAVPVRPGGDPIAALPSLRRSVLIELALAVAILAASAVLTGAPPPVSIAGPQPLAATLQLRSSTGPAGTAEVSLSPPARGRTACTCTCSTRPGSRSSPWMCR
jgi:copper transport protein